MGCLASSTTDTQRMRKPSLQEAVVTAVNDVLNSIRYTRVTADDIRLKS